MSILATAGIVAGVAGNIAGGIATSRLAKRQQEALNKEKAYSENLFNKEYYQDALSRSENASFLKVLNQRQQEETERASRTAAITGGTAEAGAAVAKNQGRNYGEAITRLASTASAHKDQALAAYNARRSALFQSQNAITEQKKANWGNVMANASNLGVAAATATTTAPLSNELNTTDFSNKATAVVPAMHANAANVGNAALNNIKNR